MKKKKKNKKMYNIDKLWVTFFKKQYNIEKNK